MGKNLPFFVFWDINVLHHYEIRFLATLKKDPDCLLLYLVDFHASSQVCLISSYSTGYKLDAPF